MTSWLIRLSVMVLLVLSTTHARGIFDTSIHSSECIPGQMFDAEPRFSTALEKPPVNYPIEVPPPRVIGHTYHIFKTVLKPQWFRQMVIIPYLQRYVRTFQAPVLETVHIQREIPF